MDAQRHLARLRGLVDAHRGRDARRARALAERLDAWLAGAGVGAGGGAGPGAGDDDEAGAEIVLRPWELRLPRLVVLAAAESRGLVPVGGRSALVERGPWLEPMRFTRGELVGSGERGGS